MYVKPLLLLLLHVTEVAEGVEHHAHHCVTRPTGEVVARHADLGEVATVDAETTEATVPGRPTASTPAKNVSEVPLNVNHQESTAGLKDLLLIDNVILNI